MFKSQSPLFIAEIGLNHNGDMKMAKLMIETAKRVGASAVKFQCYTLNKLYSIPHLTKMIGEDANKVIKAFEGAYLTEKQFEEIAWHAQGVGIDFFATPLYLEAVDFLESLKVPYHKVASLDITYHALLKRIASTGKPVFLSTGAARAEEVERALNVLNENGSGPVTLMHCISTYPCPIEDTNLMTIPWLRDRFKVPVGFSDHTTGITAALLAISMGACAIEKHFTLDRTLPGPDHFFSLTPAFFEMMVKDTARQIEMNGTLGKPVSIEERKRINLGRRGLYYKVGLSKGDTIREDHLISMRPNIEIGAERWEQIVGRRLKKDMEAREPVRAEDLL